LVSVVRCVALTGLLEGQADHLAAGVALEIDFGSNGFGDEDLRPDGTDLERSVVVDKGRSKRDWKVYCVAKHGKFRRRPRLACQSKANVLSCAFTRRRPTLSWRASRR